MSFATKGNDVAQRLESFLRRQHPHKTAECVASETGCKIDQVKKWLSQGALPSFRATIALIGAYGPEFLTEVMPDRFGWLEEAKIAERKARIERQVASLTRELDALNEQ